MLIIRIKKRMKVKNKIKKSQTFAGFFLWRRERDLNPRYLFGIPVFETGTFDHSDISAQFTVISNRSSFPK